MRRHRDECAIESVEAWEALDSRGTPTVGCEVRLVGGGSGSVTVPSGASTGSHEAWEMRDGGERYGGRGVAGAVDSVTRRIAPALRGTDAADQTGVDGLMVEIDGTPGLSNLGANAVLAVSLACSLSVASQLRIPLYRVLAAEEAPLLPLPMVNIISGGAHAGWSMDVQDLLVVPVGAESFAQAIEWAWRVRAAAAELVAGRGLTAALVADEGGLGPTLNSARDGLEILVSAIERAGLEPRSDVAIAIDVAATQLGTEAGGYRFGGGLADSESVVATIAEWARDFPLVSVEDPVGEDDWNGWRSASDGLAGIQLLGDDLFVTNADRLEQGSRESIANAILVKPNQNGTLSGAREVVEQARHSGYATVLSARSGETEDAWLADMSVAWRTGQIKVGSTTRSERTAKWNRLLRIEAELGDDAVFAGGDALARGPAVTGADDR
jgi:enolase